VFPSRLRTARPGSGEAPKATSPRVVRGRQGGESGLRGRRGERSSLRAVAGGAEGSRRVGWVSCGLRWSLGVCGGQKMPAELLTPLEGSEGRGRSGRWQGGEGSAGPKPHREGGRGGLKSEAGWAKEPEADDVSACLLLILACCFLLGLVQCWRGAGCFCPEKPSL